MVAEPLALEELEVHPVNAERWADMERLFGEKGACGGCWCMYWRHDTGNGADRVDNKTAMRRLVEDGAEPGLLAYYGGQAIGWCSVAPREEYHRLARSRNLKRVDDEPVWSVVCFFVAKPYRRRGMMTALLKAAVAYAGQHGAKIVEGYPTSSDQHFTGAGGFMGIAGVFSDAGFVEVARPSATQVFMRYTIQ